MATRFHVLDARPDGCDILLLALQGPDCVAQDVVFVRAYNPYVFLVLQLPGPTCSVLRRSFSAEMNLN